MSDTVYVGGVYPITVVGATPQDLDKLNVAMWDAEGSYSAWTALVLASENGTTITINHSDDDSYYYTTQDGHAGNNINWDPDAGTGYVTQADPSHVAGVLSPALALVHEADHSMDYWSAPSDYVERLSYREVDNPDDPAIARYTNGEDRYVIQNIEPTQAVQMGETVRDTHQGTEIVLNNPSEHTDSSNTWKAYNGAQQLVNLGSFSPSSFSPYAPGAGPGGADVVGGGDVGGGGWYYYYYGS